MIENLKDDIAYSDDLCDYVMGVFDKLGSTSSRLEKEEILKAVEAAQPDANAVFLNIIKRTYDPREEFNLKDITNLPEPEKGNKRTLYDLFSLLTKMASREVSGNNAKQEVANLLGNSNKSLAEICRRMIARDIQVGVGVKTINKVFGPTVYEHPYMRCSLLDSKTAKGLKFPVFSQTKLDGSYVDIVVTSAGVAYMTRSGQVLKLLNHPVRDAELVKAASGYVLQGEILVKNETGEIMLREDGNGYLNSQEIDNNRIVFGVWDCVPYEDFMEKRSNVPYSVRFGVLGSIVSALGTAWLEVVETVMCENIDEVIEHFKKNRARGLEGTIVKNPTLLWKSHTSKEQLKIKVVAEGDLVVVGWNEGKGKNAGMVGSLICQSSDGLVETGVNILTDKLRIQATKEVEKWIAEEYIISVKFNDIVENDLKPDMKSLYLTRMAGEPRFDKRGKENADTLERLYEELNTFEFALNV